MDQTLSFVKSLDPMLVVLVLFEMKLEESRAYQSLDRALAKTDERCQLFAYDNSSRAGALPDQGRWQIQYHHDPSNPGVSKAYNQAFTWAEGNNKKWLLLTDQDTTFPDDIFEQYKVSQANFPQCQIFAPLLIDERGLISPFRKRNSSGKRLATIKPGLHPLDKIHAVNSGLLVSMSLFRAAGGYDERLRLDFSDFSFFRRASRITSSLAVVEARCLHQHSSSARGNLQEAMERFRTYLRGSKIMAAEENPFPFRFRSFLRALKLSLRYRSLRFIGTFISGAP